MKRALRQLLSLALALLLLSAVLPAGEAAQADAPAVRVYVDGLLRLRGYDSTARTAIGRSRGASAFRRM